ncbi:O-antigen ligase family protein [Candidatus Margulisiibacteriota bacterium]
MTIKKLFNLLMIFSVFSGAFVLGSVGFEFYLSYVIFFFFILVYLLHTKSICVSKGFSLILFYFIISSLLCVIIFRLPYYLLFKQIIGITFSAVAYYLMIKMNNYDIEKLFKLYLKFAIIISTLGVFQEVSFLLNFRLGYDWAFFLPKSGNPGTSLFFLRVSSIMPEPSMLAIILTPAAFVVLANLFSKRKIYLSRLAGLVILAAYLLTFSAIGYLGLIFCSLLILYQKGYLNIKKQKVLILPVIIMILFFVFYLAYSSLPGIKSRVDAFRALASQPDQLLNLSVVMDRNASVLILYSNIDAAFNSIRKSPLFGSGLGTHAENFDKYYGRLIDEANISGKLRILRGWGFGISKADANSLFVRLLSETGIVGVLIVLWLLMRYFIKRIDLSSAADSDAAIYNLSIINNGIFLLIVMRLVRFGHYFVDGFFFFVFIYYFSNMQVKARLLAIKERPAQ